MNRNMLIAPILMLLIAFGVNSQGSVIRELNSPYSEYEAALYSDTEGVLQALTDNPLSDEQPNELKAQYYLLLSYVYFSIGEADKAMANSNRSLNLLDIQSQPWLYHTVQISRAEIFLYLDESIKGLGIVKNALEWAVSEKDKELQLYALYAQADLYISLFDYHNALIAARQAYEIATASGDFTKDYFASVMALIYADRLEYELAKPFYEEAVLANRKSGNKEALLSNLSSLGIVTSNLGQFELARAYLGESLELSEQSNNEVMVGYTLVELASIETKQGNYLVAKEHLERAIDIFSKSQDRRLLFVSHKNMARLAAAMGDFKLADSHLTLSKTYLDTNSELLEVIGLKEVEAKIHYRKENYKDAFELLESTVLAKEKHFSEKSSEQLHAIRTRYEVEASERDNELLEQQNQWQRVELDAASTRQLQLKLLFLTLTIICILLGFIAYRAKRNRTKLLFFANIDGLTGLPNRRYSFEMIHQQVELAKRHNFSLSIAIADIDFFKKVNDTYGHAIGDRVLEAFGKECKSTFRKTDIVGRIGGEEFVIALPHTNLDEAENILEKLLLNVVNMSSSLNVDGLKITVSCGLATYKSALSTEEVLLDCDQALYEAKKSGRNQIIRRSL